MHRVYVDIRLHHLCKHFPQQRGRIVFVSEREEWVYGKNPWSVEFTKQICQKAMNERPHVFLRIAERLLFSHLWTSSRRNIEPNQGQAGKWNIKYDHWQKTSANGHFLGVKSTLPFCMLYWNARDIGGTNMFQVPGNEFFAKEIC